MLTCAYVVSFFFDRSEDGSVGGGSMRFNLCDSVVVKVKQTRRSILRKESIMRRHGMAHAKVVL